MNQTKSKNSVGFEVYNFGISGWTTAHSLSNFVLNIVDYQPDIVIIHHAWNDGLIRNTTASSFRSDYAHVYQPFQPPFIYDRYLLRSSILYRYLKWQVHHRPSWTALETATLIKNNAYDAGKNFQDTTELIPFRRNIETLIDLAQAKEMRVLLSTQPHSSDSSVALFFLAPHIDRCNAILRQLAKEKKDLWWIDLDHELSGKRNELFIDLGHMTEEGKQLKAELIGKLILSQYDSIQNIMEQ